MTISSKSVTEKSIQFVTSTSHPFQKRIFAVVALGLKTIVCNGAFQCFSVFSATDLFCTSGVSVSCLGNAASRKEIYHAVNHTQKHGREVFTPKLIAL